MSKSWLKPPTAYEKKFAQRAADVLRQHLALWPLYKPEHQVFGVACGDHAISLAYRTGPPAARDCTHLDLNIVSHKPRQRICYLVSIRLDREHRGQGLGRQLYELVEHVAKELRCSCVTGTASGMTPTGDTREAYMQRLGYDVDEYIFTKELRRRDARKLDRR